MELANQSTGYSYHEGITLTSSKLQADGIYENELKLIHESEITRLQLILCSLRAQCTQTCTSLQQKKLLTRDMIHVTHSSPSGANICLRV